MPIFIYKEILFIFTLFAKRKPPKVEDIQGASDKREAHALLEPKKQPTFVLLITSIIHSIMAHRLNTNKQFMIGNGILAFAVIFVVVIFVYMSMRLQQQKAARRTFIETYTLTLAKGFVGDSTSVYINDSLLLNCTLRKEPFTIQVQRFDEHCALMIVDNLTEKISLFELSESGGTYTFEKENEAVKMLPQ